MVRVRASRVVPWKAWGQTGLEPQELAQLLKKGSISAGYATEMWTLPRIAALIQEKFAVRLAISSVWGLLGRMGWSVQRPTGQARQRDEHAITTWKNKRWPELKVRQAKTDASSR